MLTWLEPYLAWGLEHLESGSPVAMVLTLVAGMTLGLTPATYPMLPAEVSYVAGEEKLTRGRAATLGLAFALGACTAYTLLGFVFDLTGLALLALLNRSIWLWYGLLAPFLWVMGRRSLGFLCFGVPLMAAPRLQRRRRSALGAYLIGILFELAGCPTCTLVLPSVLVAVAASGNPFLRALAML